MFPGVRCCTYDSLETEGRDYDCLLHLATMNNNANEGIYKFTSTNVDFLLKIVDRAKAANISHFVNASSVHALDEKKQSPYAQSKREAAKRLAHIDNIGVTTLYLPLVYGSTWPDSLAALNYFPAPLARFIFALLASFRPTLHVSKIASFLIAAHPPSSFNEVILSDRQSTIFIFSKRALDIGCALAISILFWWLIALIWFIVKMDSRGPGFFFQARVGKHGHIFTCYKFRTMVSSAPNVATHEASAGLVTSSGRLLRRTKLDELPQIFNVLFNDMSFIGPRPCLPTQTELIEARRKRGVLELKPGISGLAQIKNIDMRDPERLAVWDARYRALECLTLDLKIMLATVRGRGRGDSVGMLR